MKAVITADIINSTNTATNSWMDELKKTLTSFGKESKDWEIYRGDEFQVLLADPRQAFHAVMIIKASLHTKNLDARIAIGLGTVNYQGASMKESNGSAFINSGRTLEILKATKSQNICLKSDYPDLDENLNLLFLLLESSLERWTASNATAILAYLNNTTQTQQEIAQSLQVTQGAYSRALKRANAEAISRTEQYFTKKISEIL